MVGGEAGSTSQHFSHPAVEPVSPSYLPGWPRLTLRTSGVRICRVEDGYARPDLAADGARSRSSGASARHPDEAPKAPTPLVPR